MCKRWVFSLSGSSPSVISPCVTWPGKGIPVHGISHFPKSTQVGHTHKEYLTFPHIGKTREKGGKKVLSYIMKTTNKKGGQKETEEQEIKKWQALTDWRQAVFFRLEPWTDKSGYGRDVTRSVRQKIGKCQRPSKRSQNRRAHAKPLKICFKDLPRASPDKRSTNLGLSCCEGCVTLLRAQTPFWWLHFNGVAQEHKSIAVMASDALCST